MLVYMLIMLVYILIMLAFMPTMLAMLIFSPFRGSGYFRTPNYPKPDEIGCTEVSAVD